MLTWGDVIFFGNLFPDQELDCMVGNCIVQKYRRKKVFVKDWYASNGACIDLQSEMCSEIQGDLPSPTSSGFHEIRWRGCAVPTESNIYYEDQSDAVRFVQMWLDQRWCTTTYPCAGCFGATGQTDGFRPVNLCNNDPNPFGGCLTIIRVDYEFTDDGVVGNYRNDADDNCERVEVQFSYSQVYVCYYARRNSLNEKIAVGQYRLMSVEVTPFNTYKAKPEGQCCRACKTGTGGDSYFGELIRETASSYESAPHTPQTLPWKPPQYIDLTRIC
jgi:hypothetical protein